MIFHLLSNTPMHSYLQMMLNASRKYVPPLTAIHSKITYLVGAYSGICTLMKQNVLYSRFCSKLPRVLFNYTINNTAIQFSNCHRDLGILVSSDLKWSNLIISRPYKVPGLIQCSFSSSLDIRAKISLSPTSSISTHLWFTDLEATSCECQGLCC